MEEHIEQVLFVFPVDTLGLKVGMAVKTVVDRKNVNEKQLLQEVNSQSVSLSDMSAKTEIHKTGVEKTTNRTTGGWYWYGIILLVLVLVCWICRLMKNGVMVVLSVKLCTFLWNLYVYSRGNAYL